MTPEERDPGAPDGGATEEFGQEPYESEGDTGDYEAHAIDDSEPYDEPGDIGQYEAYRGGEESAEGYDDTGQYDAADMGEHAAPPAAAEDGVLDTSAPENGAAGDAVAPAPGLAPCPTCGEPVERRQLVCLNCGGRVALSHGRSFLTEPVVPLLVVVVVIGAALFGFAIAEITSGSGDDGGGQAARQPGSSAPAVVEGEGQGQAANAAPETATTPGAQPSENSGTRVARRNPLAWPRGLTAHTVVLVTTSDRAGALRTAKQARSTGLEAGLLPSDRYNLGTGLWVVFSGRFSTREGAARQAAQLSRRYPGAYPQLIQRSQ